MKCIWNADSCSSPDVWRDDFLSENLVSGAVKPKSSKKKQMKTNLSTSAFPKPFLMVALSCFILSAAPTLKAGDIVVYFGNLHSHTSYSDGSGTPSDAYKSARDKAKLDFMAITEHNHSQAESGAGSRRDGLLIATDHSLYNGSQSSSLTSSAKAFNKDGSFVALYGQEFSSISKGNHVNVFDIDAVIDEAVVPNGDFNALINWLGSHPDSQNAKPILEFNHPSNQLRQQGIEYGADDFSSQKEWVTTIGAQACLIELLNGPALTDTLGHRSDPDFQNDYLYYLGLGFKLAPTGDQDNHYRTWGLITDSRTAVITDALTKSKILEAIRARHVYATEDKNLRIIFTVQGHLCGDVIKLLPAVGSHLDIKYSINDDDEPNASYAIEVFQGVVGGTPAASVNTENATGNNSLANLRTIDDVVFSGGSQFLFFKITQTGEDGKADRAWTAPIWFEGNTPEVAGPGSMDDVANLVASKRSAIYHLSASCKSVKTIRPENLVTGAAAKLGRSPHQGCPL